MRSFSRISLLFATAAITLCGAPPEVLLWNNGAPGSPKTFPKEVWTERGKNGVVDRAVEEIHQPSLTVYLPEANASGAAVIICPGGGFSHEAIDKEGHDIARWLNTHGVAGLVLKYRLPKSKGAAYTVDTALADVQRAIRLTRARAQEWRLDPKRIGVAGFSAGGTLAELAGTRFDDPIAAGGSGEAIDLQSARPDFLILGYTGGVAKDLGVTSELKIPAGAPPAFMVHADDDKVSAMRSITFYSALKQAGIPAELHIFNCGGHGFGVVDNHVPLSGWPALCIAWLTDRGIIGPPHTH